jgi:predicted CopG family antitoxin
MEVTITEHEYEELMRIKREHQFITERLYGQIKALKKEADKLNKSSFTTNDGDAVQKIEWVTLRHKICELLYLVPDQCIEELLK